MNFLGADTEQLRGHGERTEKAAGRLGELIDGLRSVVASAHWEGSDAQAFRDDAERVWERAGTTSEELSAHAADLRAQADEQDAASDGDAGSGGGQGAGGGPAGSGSTVTDDGKRRGNEPLEEDIPLEGEETDLDNSAQGSIADCYLLSSLGSIIQEDPDFLENHVKEVGDGVYEVTMYDENGDEVTYVVKSTPEDGARVDEPGGGQNVYSIYERAYQMHLEQQGDGDTLDWGFPPDAMKAVTGQDANYYGGSDTPPIEDMAKLLENDRPMTADTGGIDSPHNSDIAGQHAYQVTSVDVKKNTVTVVNPWAGHETVTMKYDDYVKTFQGTAVGRTEPRSASEFFSELFDGTSKY